MKNEIIHVDKPNFDLAKQKIGTSLTKVPKSVRLENFRESGTWIPWNNHNVTGAEINTNLVAPLQKMLIDQNNNIKNIFQTLNDVYQAFETLDKEYIHGILAAVKSAEMASNQAKDAGIKAEKASRQALDAVGKANIAQKDINNTIDALLSTVENLKKFKEKVTNELSILSTFSNQVSSLKQLVQTNENRYNSIKQSVGNVQSASAKLNKITHLDDVDLIWNDVKRHKDDLSKVHSDHELFVSQVGETIGRINDDINSLQAYRSQLESYSHLSDIDTIWSNVESHKDDLSQVHADLESFVSQVRETTTRINDDINSLLAYRSQLESYSHLSDIDTIWSNVESHKDDLSKVHSDHELFVSQVGETIGRINDDINSLQAYRSQLESYSHLGDIDTIWSDVANHKEHLSILDKLLEDLMDDTNQKTEDLKKEISEMAIAQKEINEQLSKKIKIAYRIAGCAMAFSIGQFVLQWFGVL